MLEKTAGKSDLPEMTEGDLSLAKHEFICMLDYAHLESVNEEVIQVQEPAGEEAIQAQESVREEAVQLQKPAREDTLRMQDSSKEDTLHMQEPSKEDTLHMQDSSKEDTLHMQEPSKEDTLHMQELSKEDPHQMQKSEEDSTLSTQSTRKEELLEQKAQVILRDESKLRKLLKKLRKWLLKARYVPVLGDVIEDVVTMMDLLTDYVDGSYRQIPTRFLVAIIMCILYLVCPFNLIPDYIPVIGYLDDVAIITKVLSSGLSGELDRYREWKKEQTTE